MASSASQLQLCDSQEQEDDNNGKQEVEVDGWAKLFHPLNNCSCCGDCLLKPNELKFLVCEACYHDPLRWETQRFMAPSPKAAPSQSTPSSTLSSSSTSSKAQPCNRRDWENGIGSEPWPDSFELVDRPESDNKEPPAKSLKRKRQWQ